MTKRAAVINDLSGFGKCSLTAAIAVLSAMGIQPCPMPTAVLTNQSGYDSFQCVDFTENLCGYIEKWSENNAVFDAIFSGYITNDRQIDIIAEFIKRFRTEKTVVLVDPVMADRGVIYKNYNREMCLKMREIAFSADYITPNLTELCVLTDNDYAAVEPLSGEKLFSKVEDMAMSLVKANNQTVIATGVPDGDRIYSCIFQNSHSNFIEAKLYKGSFSGTGDLFASAFLGGILNGLSADRAAEKASGFLEKSIADTVCINNFDRNDGIEFEKNLRYLLP